MAYELWESTSGNMIADFLTKEAALEAVRVTLKSGSNSNVSGWLLLYQDQEGEITHIASAGALLDLARSTAA